MKKATPQEEHRWLRKLLGTWSVEASDPDSEETFTGTETFRPVGEIWVIGEGHGQTPGGGESTSLITLGFSPERQKFVSTWLGSMMTHLWVCEGTLDAGRTKLVLECEGPSFTQEGKMDRYRDTIEFLTDDHRTLTASVLGADGKWTDFMTTHYRRTS